MPWAWNEKVLAVEMGWGGKMGKEERGRGEAVSWLLQDQLSPILFMQSEATMSAVLGFGGQAHHREGCAQENRVPIHEITVNLAWLFVCFQTLPMEKSEPHQADHLPSLRAFSLP